MAQSDYIGNGGKGWNEVRSHSSMLFNERLAILWYVHDVNMLNLRSNMNYEHLARAFASLQRIWMNVRTFVFYNDYVRGYLNLRTKDPGIFTPDVGFALVSKFLTYARINGLYVKDAYYMIEQLDRLELILRDILQFFSYFIRPDYKQKPDLQFASREYQKMADPMTVEQLQKIVGKRHRLDFDRVTTPELPRDEEDEDLEGDYDDSDE